MHTHTRNNNKEEVKMKKSEGNVGEVGGGGRMWK